MSQCPEVIARRTESYYGAFAFASVVVTAFASFLSNQRFYASESWVWVVFAAGAVYASFGVLWSGVIDETAPFKRLLYYTVQIALVTLILYASPSRGFLGIVVLPLVSQAIFDLRARWASVVGGYLFLATICVWGIPVGLRGVLQAVLNYATAFIFTVAFTIITKKALIAREHASALRVKVERANEQLRAYAAQAEELATTRERNRLAREIHDGVGHYLTVIKTQLDAAAALLPDQPERARDVVQKAAKLSADALDDVRRSVGAFRSDHVRPPLPDAVRALVSEAALPVDVRVEGDLRPLPPAVEHAIFRAAQEALTNIRKHAAATAATLRLDFSQPQRLVLEVADNGRGCRGAVPESGQGFGLQGMRERIEVLGGRVSSENRPEGGFLLTVEVPG